MSIRHKLAACAAALYLMGGLVVSGLGYAIPAINLKGHAYIFLIWPWMIAAGSFHAPQPPIPNWVFTFKDRP